MKKKKYLSFIFLTLSFLILIASRLSYMNNPRTLFKEHATVLNIQGDYIIKDYASFNYWFGDKDSYYLIEYNESMLTQLSIFEKNYLLQKHIDHKEISFEDLLDVFKDSEVYKQIVSQKYEYLYYYDNYQKQVKYYIFILNESTLAIFMMTG